MDIQGQELIYMRLAPIIGHDMALYCLCAVFDKPYIAENEAEGWEDYLSGISDGEFTDGETDVNAALLSGMPTQDRWATIWGEGYTENDYKQLDNLYQTMTSQLDSKGGIDPQQRDVARTCARMALNRNKLISSYKDKDAIATANTLDKMIRENLKDSNMRKADILPAQAQRLDGFVDALRKKGLTPEMTEEDVLNHFYGWLKKKKYPNMTTDAADWMLLSIMRTMAKNDDMPEPVELDEDMSLAQFESEFASEPNAQEQETYEYLGMVRGGAVGRKTKEDGE